MPGIYDYLPPRLERQQVRAALGIISDTHMPQRWPALPPPLSDLFAGADLLLHAGDVGELWVLDRLSQLAPVVAVHGNDDTEAAQRELPEQQLLTVAGQRLLLWHSHHREREAEMAFRRIDAWEPKLERIAARALRAEADIAVFGHTHISMQRRYRGVLLVNPGAIASGNFFTRQRRQTVALLFLTEDEAAAVHVDLARPERPYVAEVSWERGFAVADAVYQESILAPDLAPYLPTLLQQQYEQRKALQQLLLRLAHRCWAGEQQVISRQDLLQALAQDGTLEEDRATIQEVLEGSAAKEL